MSIATHPTGSPSSQAIAPDVCALLDDRAHVIEAMGRAIRKARAYAPGTLPHTTYMERARKHERASAILRARILAAAGIENASPAAIEPEPPEPASSTPAGDAASSNAGQSPQGESAGDPGEGKGETPWHRDALGVLDVDGLWLAGEDREAPEHITGADIPQPGPDVDALAMLALARTHELGQLWIHPRWAIAAGLPTQGLDGRELRTGIAHPFAAGAWDNPAPGAWGMYGPGMLRPWMRFYVRGTSGTLALSLPHLDRRSPWCKASDAPTLLAALMDYREALGGFTYRSGPGATSTALLHALHKRNRASLDLAGSMRPQDFPAPAREPGLTPQIGWLRLLTADELARGLYVHGYDKNGMFLAACSSLRVGMGTPDYLDTPDALAPAVRALTSPARPIRRPAGYWRARVTFPGGAPAAGLLLHPCYTGPAQPDPAAAPQWYHTATLALAVELGAQLDIDAAYIWGELHEPLEPWYQHLRAARATLAQAMGREDAGSPAAALALAAVKATYTQGLGWLDPKWLRESDDVQPLYRPDWRHAAIATANANLWRNLAQVYSTESRAPFAILTDAAYYVSDNPDPLAAAPAGLRLGDGLGQYKVKLAAFPVEKLAPVWEYFAAGRELGRVVSAFGWALGESEG